jgi:hypothetical protein
MSVDANLRSEIVNQSDLRLGLMSGWNMEKPLRKSEVTQNYA